MTIAAPAKEPPRLTLKHIEAREDLDSFQCGAPETDRWAREKAHKFHARGRARGTLARPDGSKYRLKKFAKRDDPGDEFALRLLHNR
jgi:hypothetical protein